MAEENVQQESVKYLDYAGLQHVWRKIGELYPRTENLGNLLDALEDPFIRKALYDADQEALSRRIDELEAATGTTMDGDTIVRDEKGKLSTNIIMDIDEESKTLRLVTRATDSNNNTPKVISEIDYRPFVKDGMLDSVSIVVKTDEDPETGEPTGEEAGTYLKFVFNTDAGKEAIYLNATEFVNVYVGDDYISVDGDHITLNTVALDSYLEEYITRSAFITDIKTTVGSHSEQIKSIQTNIATVEATMTELSGKVTELSQSVQEMEQAVDACTLDVEEIKEVLKTVPTEPISIEEIDKLK